MGESLDKEYIDYDNMLTVMDQFRGILYAAASSATLGLALPATAISNITLVKAVKLTGPTLTSLLGALEPLMAVLIGVFIFKELFTVYSVSGIILVLASVSLVLYQQRKGTGQMS